MKYRFPQLSPLVSQDFQWIIVDTLESSSKKRAYEVQFDGERTSNDCKGAFEIEVLSHMFHGLNMHRIYLASFLLQILHDYFVWILMVSNNKESDLSILVSSNKLSSTS